MSREQKINDFYEALKDLSDAEKSRLRRASSSPSTDARIFDILAHLPIYSKWDRDKYDLCAILYSVAYQCPATDKDHFNIGSTLKDCDFSDIRMKALLDTDSENLTFRLRQVFSFINSNRKALNWKVIISDILNWDSDSKYIQRKWAEGYFAPYLKEQLTKGE